VDSGGRVLLLIARGLFWRGEPYWLTVGGGLEPSETLAQAGARELREEAGIAVDPGALGGALGTSVIERRCIEGHQWLTAGELAGWPVRVADLELPRLMRAAVAAARWPA
jgi:8-oxo-dGTP pyrophosphatase MutT (NUDIX family)